MPYFIYLPPGYRSEGRLYPVLFLLHGNSGSYEEWLAYGFVDRVDRMIVRNEISPIVVVFPQGDFSYWVNSPWEEGLRWGDYLSVDLVRHIGATYRVFADPERRAVGGLSMGGTGALVNAFWRPTYSARSGLIARPCRPKALAIFSASTEISASATRFPLQTCAPSASLG